MAALFRWDDFVLDLDSYRLERAGRPLALEPKAFNLLVLLVQRPGHLFTKQEIFDSLWPDTAVTDHALTRVVAQLRRVLGDEAREARYIETVPTRGYRWVRPLLPSAPPAPDGTVVAVAGSSQAGPSQAGPPRWYAAVAAGLILAAIVVTLVVMVQRGSPTSAAAGAADPLSVRDPGHVRLPVQVTTHAGLELHPAFSPQGDALAFVSDRSGEFEIYVRAMGGAAADTPLTGDGGHNVQPAWSPDGRFIAYHSYRRGGVWVIPSRGGPATQVAAEGSHPAWSPDGARLAFQSDEHADVTPRGWGAQSGSTIWIAGADGSGLRELTRAGQPAGGHASPAWSRDGRHLAFTVFEGGRNGGIWIVNTEGGDARILEAGDGLYEVVFAADNSALYAAGGEAAIVRLPFDAATGALGGPREVIPVPGVPGVRGLAVAPDGRGLAFAGLALSSQIWMQRLDPDGAGVGPSRPLTSDTSRRNALPTIAPDGTTVAYASTRAGEPPNIWIMDLDGRQPQQMTDNGAANHQPRWLPDGRRVAYMSNQRGKYGLWAVDIATRREDVLFDPFGVVGNWNVHGTHGRLAEVELAPSASRLAFSMIPATGRRVLYVSPLDRLSPQALTDGTSSVGYPAWSPDERHIAVEVKDGSSTHAAVIDVQSGVMRPITGDRGQTWVRSWSPDGRKVAAAVLRDGLWSLISIDVSTGRQQPMTPASPPHVYVRYPAWSPRGNLVVFERGELRGDIWTLALP